MKRLDRILRVEESERKFQEATRKEKLEKKDLPALIIAAFFVFLPALLLVSGVLILVMWLFFFH